MKRLIDFTQDERFDLVIRASQEKIRFFAEVIPKDWLYFCPDNDPTAAFPAVGGYYEIAESDVRFVTECIEINASSAEFEESFISPDGHKGVLGMLISFKDVHRIEPHIFDFPLHRILVDLPTATIKKRSRSDAIRTAIEAYLDKCGSEGKAPNLDACWRFVSEYQSIDVTLDGVLTYPMYDGKVPGKCTRSQLSGRLGRAKKAR